MQYVKSSATPHNYKNFMNGWTIFYWGWWIAWAPFVGTFIAKISRGRTIREFIAATIIAPIIYVLLWFNVFGAIGIKSYRFSMLANIDCDEKKVTWQAFAEKLKTSALGQ